MSLISGSYSRVLATAGALLLRAAIVEKDEAAAVREEMGLARDAWRAIGLIALVRTVER